MEIALGKQFYVPLSLRSGEYGKHLHIMGGFLIIQQGHTPPGPRTYALLHMKK